MRLGDNVLTGLERLLPLVLVSRALYFAEYAHRLMTCTRLSCFRRSHRLLPANLSRWVRCGAVRCGAVRCCASVVGAVRCGASVRTPRGFIYWLVIVH